MQSLPDSPKTPDADLLLWDEEAKDEEELDCDAWEARRDERTRVILKLLNHG